MPAPSKNQLARVAGARSRSACLVVIHTPKKNLPDWLLVGLQFFAGPVLGIVLWTVVPGLAAIYEV